MDDPARAHSLAAHRRGMRDGAHSNASARAAETGGETPAAQSRQRSRLLIFLRYVLPTAVVVFGIVVMSFGSESDLEGGAAIVSAGLGIYLLNVLVRLGNSGERQRDAEDDARAFFDAHGRWPD